MRNAAFLLVACALTFTGAVSPVRAAGDKGLHNMLQNYYGIHAIATGDVRAAKAARAQLAALKPGHPDLPTIDGLLQQAVAAVDDLSIPAGFAPGYVRKPFETNLFYIAFNIYMSSDLKNKPVAVAALHIIITRCQLADRNAKHALKLIHRAMPGK